MTGMIIDTGRDRFDSIGYIPAVGSVFGFCRILYGAIKIALNTILMLGSLLWSASFNGHHKDIGMGFLHICRGTVELFPFVGGSCLWIYDILRI